MIRARADDISALFARAARDSQLREEGGQLTMRDQRYVPALAYRPLTVIYDPVVRLTTRESTVKSALVLQARLQPGDRVLDLGCGTATLAIAVKQQQPRAEVVGVDGDTAILRRARAKAARAGVVLRLEEALAHRMPFPDASFDCVLSSLLFHHLDREHKFATLHEVYRVLRPGGQLHVADWGKARNGLMRGLFLAVQLLDGFENTSDSVAGRLPAFMSECGFKDVVESARFATILGTISLYRGSRAGSV
jgi:SAM-dependent methyltransferase